MFQLKRWYINPGISVAANTDFFLFIGSMSKLYCIDIYGNLS